MNITIGVVGFFFCVVGMLIVVAWINVLKELVNINTMKAKLIYQLYKTKKENNNDLSKF